MEVASKAAELGEVASHGLRKRGVSALCTTTRRWWWFYYPSPQRAQRHGSVKARNAHSRQLSVVSSAGECPECPDSEDVALWEPEADSTAVGRGEKGGLA